MQERSIIRTFTVSVGPLSSVATVERMVFLSPRYVRIQPICVLKGELVPRCIAGKEAGGFEDTHWIASACQKTHRRPCVTRRAATPKIDADLR